MSEKSKPWFTLVRDVTKEKTSLTIVEVSYADRKKIREMNGYLFDSRVLGESACQDVMKLPLTGFFQPFKRYQVYCLRRRAEPSWDPWAGPRENDQASEES